MSIRNCKTFGVHRGPRGVELDFDAVRVKGHCPKQPTGRNNRGIVVNLFRRVHRTGEDIQSYEPEYALMQLTVFSDELAFHETHVRLKYQRTIRKSRTSSASTDSV